MTQYLSKIISSTSDARLRLRLLAVSHFLDGKNRTQIPDNHIIKHHLFYG